jgi:hypothetical protein
VSGLVESFLFFKLRVGSGIDRASLSDVSAWRSPVTYAASPSLACCCCFHCWVSGRHLTVRRESTSRQSTVIRRIRIVTTSSICCFHCWVSGRHLTQCVAYVRSISVHPAARSASVCASSPYSTYWKWARVLVQQLGEEVCAPGYKKQQFIKCCPKCVTDRERERERERENAR